ncbi:hypothetical protein ACG2F4_15190 [Halalkalibaculum sp. DA3122]|uniref:hypothetical protein n=1 Tax=Halalkalibaculum sp. DA3122 TaxID=3373607 RepID=UPI003753F3F9
MKLFKPHLNKPLDWNFFSGLNKIYSNPKQKREVVMSKPVECPECGATAVEPCHKEPVSDCVREENK